MNKTTKTIIGVIIILLVIGGAYYFTKNNSQSNEYINIGYIGPLTGDGAAWGVVEQNTINIAIKEINEKGGINGKKLNLVSEDDKCEGKTAVSAFQKLVQVNKIGIVFVSCSQSIIPIAPIAQQNKVIAWTSYASASSISNLGEFIFRNSYTNKDMGRSMAEVAILKGKKAVIISELSEFASDLRDIFISEYQTNGGSVVAREDFQQGAKDFRAQISKMLFQNPDVVVINPNSPATGIAALKQVRELGFKGQIVGNFFGGSKEVQSLKEAQGMIYVSDPLLADSSIKQHVFEAYKNTYGSYPDLEWPVGARYDAVYILKNALMAVGDDPIKVKDYLHNMPSDFTGVLGTYRFNKGNSDITNVKPSILKIENYKSTNY